MAEDINLDPFTESEVNYTEIQRRQYTYRASSLIIEPFKWQESPLSDLGTVFAFNTLITMSQLTITTSIIGLAIASQLSRHHEITVIARDLPGDEPSIKWASPWAGANFVAGGCSSARERRMQMDAFTELWRLAIRHPESGVKRLPMEEFYDNERSDDDLWFKDFIPGV